MSLVSLRSLATRKPKTPKKPVKAKTPKTEAFKEKTRNTSSNSSPGSIHAGPASAAPSPSASAGAPAVSATAASPSTNVASSTVEVFVNGKAVSVPAGSAAIQACAEAGVEIPRFCYHERLAIAGNCRMCLVQVEKMPKLVVSCAQPVAPGMRIQTDTPAVKKGREGVMEFLLANHPLDCPICDQGGECDLQDQAMAYGSDRSRYNVATERKRAVEDKDFGPLIKTSMNRCIHCTRCVRFANEVGGLPELGTTGRGNDMQIGTYVQQMLGSELSANIIDLCPVGALTSRPYAFAARPWELRHTESIDVLDAVGSAIRIDARGNDVLRILPRENGAVNEEWLADKSRFAVDGLATQRLTVPMVHGVSSKWSAALIAASEALTTAIREDGPSSVAAIAGPFADAESLAVARDFMKALGAGDQLFLASSLMDSVHSSSLKELPVGKEGSALLRSNLTLEQMEHADAVLLLGSNLRHDAPLMNARIRKAFLSQKNWMGGFIGGDSEGKGLDLNWEYEHLGTDLRALEALEATAFWKRFSSEAERPMLIVSGALLMEHPNSAAILGRVCDLARKLGGRLLRPGWQGLCFPVRGASHVGAMQLGWRKPTAAHRSELDGKRVLLMIGSADAALSEHSNPRSDQFRVYLGHHADRGALTAAVALPAAAYTEKTGTFISLEGRVQRTRAAATPPADAKEEWEILRALGEFAGVRFAYDTVEELRSQRLEWHLGSILPPSGTELVQIKGLATDLQTQPAHATPFGVVNLPDYYMTDVISRASPTMAKCSIAFSGKTARSTEEVDRLYRQVTAISE